MEQLILWFNIMGFTLLFASLGASYLVYGRLKPRWLFSYLFYLGIYAFFTIFNTYEFFSRVYLPESLVFLDSLTMYITFLIALALLIVIPRFIFSLFTLKQTPLHIIPQYIVAGIFLVMMLISIKVGGDKIAAAGSVFMNFYLGLVTLYGIIRIRQAKDRQSFGVVTPFLYLSCFFYFIVVLQTIFLPLLTSPLINLQINHFTAGLICFSWGAVTLIYILVKNPLQTAGTVVLSEEFASRFGITPREKEIIAHLLHGKSNKEIGEELFVSPRTVETHIYNIYRKCSVKNKMELSRQITSMT